MSEAADPLTAGLRPAFAFGFRIAALALRVEEGDELGTKRMETPAERARARRVFETRVVGLARRVRLQGSIEDRHVPGPAGPVPIRVYRPEHDGPLPVIVYLHGGGFCVGSPGYTDGVTRLLAAQTPAVVISVDYRLAPEDPFPAGLDDCEAVVAWAADRALEVGGRAGPVAVAGDSAGGNLAAALALRDRARAARRIALQALVYPTVDLTRTDRPSFEAFARGFGLSRLTVEDCLARYVPTPAERANPEVSPLLAPSLEGVAPALIATAGYDVLRDEGIAYVRRLEEAGVPVQHLHFPRVPHGFVTMTRVCGEADQAIEAIAAEVRERLASQPEPGSPAPGVRGDRIASRMADLVVVKGVHRGAFAKVVEGSVVIGRAADADLSLGEDAKASHRHARVSALGNERYFLEDLGSTNGTFVNNERVEQTPLRSGDLVKIGRSLIVFRAGASSVRLEDVATNDGGSTGSIARRSDMSAEEAASSSAVDLPPGAQRAPEDTAVRQALQELIVAAGEVALASGLDRTLAVVQRAVGGTRVLLFLRHPMTGGLGCAASRADPSMASTPVESSLLARAVRGEVVAGDHAAAAPIRIQGLPAGALYVDGCANKPGGLDVLVAACVLAGLQVGLDRSRRLASGASEIVGLGQAKVEKRALDLSAHLGAAEQMYVNAAQQRGVTLEVAAPPGVVVNVDPGLFSRGLDRLVEHVLNDARGWIGMSLVPADPGRARLLLRATLSQVPEPPGTILSPQGVAADLRHAWEVFGDGMLAVARVALQRAGARLSAQPDGPTVVFMLEMEPTTL